MKINQLDISDRQDIGKYMFSLANGNHILRYTEVSYDQYLIQHPNAIIRMLLLYHISMNWGYDDKRMYESYDEQWLATRVDPHFKSNLDFDLIDFKFQKLLPYQKAIIHFTQQLFNEVGDISLLFEGGTPIEQIYAVFAANLDIDEVSQEVKNEAHAIQRGLEMYKTIFIDEYKTQPPFEEWELYIY